MVKEASLIKQKQKDIVKGKKGRDVQSERHLKESIIGQINILSKKSRTTRIEEDDIDDSDSANDNIANNGIVVVEESDDDDESQLNKQL